MASDHIVPRMMIKRFAGVDGKLAELRKDQLTIPHGRVTPKRILCCDDYYADLIGDFDDELLKESEQRFALYYPMMADDSPAGALRGHGGSAFCQWVAAMLVRTSMLAILGTTFALSKRDETSVIWAVLATEFVSLARTVRYNELLDLVSRPDYKWKMRIFSDANVVLTDNPVCQTNGKEFGGQVIIVPLSKSRVLIGGRPDAIESICCLSLSELNVLLAGYAENVIYCDDQRTLRFIRLNLTDQGDVRSVEWRLAARQPFFGIANRITQQVRDGFQSPDGWWEAEKDSYGPSVLGVPPTIVD